MQLVIIIAAAETPLLSGTHSYALAEAPPTKLSTHFLDGPVGQFKQFIYIYIQISAIKINYLKNIFATDLNTFAEDHRVRFGRWRCTEMMGK